ncbi:flippase [Candidatus Microgenomates bacterium]|nr:flippase [Candidatus Microgenomates bacterium]
MSTKLTIFYNTTAQAVGRFFTAGITYFITLFLVREYGAVGFGEFTKILTYVSYFYIFADFGANAYIVKKLSEDEETSLKHLSNLMGLRLIFALFLIFLSLAFLVVLPQGSGQGFTFVTRIGVIIASLTMITQAMITTFSAWFQKNLRYDKLSLTLIIGNLFTLIVAYFITLSSLPVYYVFVAYVFGQAISVFLCYLLAEKKFGLGFDFTYWKRIIAFSWPLGLTLIFNLVYFKVDSFILTLTRSTQEVGIYGLAYKFFEMAIIFPSFFMNSLYPVFLEKLKERPGNFSELTKNIGVFLIGTSLVLALTIFFIAPFLINFTAGDKQADFVGGISALRILSLSLPAFFLSSFFMWVLITTQKQILLVPFYGFSMILNIFLNILLIPRYGYLAAASTTLITEVCVTLLLAIPVWRIIKKNKTSG